MRAAALALALLGCAGGLSLRLDLVEPAAIPAHVFPRVLVRGTGSIAAEILADAIAGELRGRDLDVHELGPVEPLEEYLGRAGAVLLVEVAVVESRTVETRRWVEVQSSMATPGTVDRFRDVTVLSARVELVMRDARTGTEFAREHLERAEDELDMGAAGRLAEELEDGVLALFRPSRVGRDVPLRALRSEAGARALEDARAGRIGEAVATLRALTRRAAELPEGERVALYFDLGQVLRLAALDAGVDVDDEARAALEEAMSLAPSAEIGAALEALAEEHEARARARAEAEAYAANRD